MTNPSTFSWAQHENPKEILDVPSLCPKLLSMQDLVSWISSVLHLGSLSLRSGCLQACIGTEKPCPHGVSLLESASHFSWSCPSLKIWSSTAQVMCLCQGAWEKLWGGSASLSWQKRKQIQTLGSKRTAWLVTSGFDGRSAQELNSCFKLN